MEHLSGSSSSLRDDRYPSSTDRRDGFMGEDVYLRPAKGLLICRSITILSSFVGHRLRYVPRFRRLTTPMSLRFKPEIPSTEPMKN